MRRKYTVWIEGEAHVIEEGEAWDAFRADHEFVQAAGGAVMDEQRRLLVIRRLGKWDLPKGKVEKGEGMEEAALREVREECGLNELRILSPMQSTWHTYERKGRKQLKRTDWFLMQGSNAEKLIAQTAEDIEEVLWAGRREMPAILSGTYPSLLSVMSEWERAVARLR